MSSSDRQTDTDSSTAGRRLASRILLGLALAFVAWAVASHLPPVPARARGDDQYYLRYLQVVSANGLSAFPGLFERWNASQVDRLFPPPSRVGYIVTSVVWGKLVGADYRSLQTLSLGCFLLLCVLNYAFARRHFDEERACLVGALTAFSPLLMGLSRLAFSDSYAALCMTATIWLFLEVVKDPESRGKRAVFVAAVAWSALVKELSILLLVPFLAFLVFERFARREPHRILAVASSLACAGVAVAGVLMLAAGGFEPLRATLSSVLASPSSNRYALRFGSGPWFRPILDFLLLSPWPILLATGWFWITANRLRAGRYERESVYFAFLSASMLLVLCFFTKNLRYVIMLELPIRVFAVLLVCDLARGLGGRRARSTSASGSGSGLGPAVASAAAVALLCWLDWQNFGLFWVQHPGADPITQFLANVRNVIP